MRKTEAVSTPQRVLDTSGLTCPMPLLKTKLALNGMSAGDVLEVVATDPGSLRDIPAFIKLSYHELVDVEEAADRFRFFIRCGQSS
ncbi:sulfurtransferase TusA family protein [Mangrovitalea sediminis]|uniref:sulfurtransferase TusA family protein n=1 Tax=Mangrovitalea sediminis TaxID=1982043 RepID=UPI000BE61E0E|nr:sulfurtransferase TusA family protein [Mangrovitalea sediminis]